MSERDMMRWAICAAVDASDLPDSVVAVELMQEAARLIAWSGALPHRCDRAAKLFRAMIAEEADGAPFPITEVMVEAYRAAVVNIERARSARNRRRA
jgi:hypothetical protein